MNIQTSSQRDDFNLTVIGKRVLHPAQHVGEIVLVVGANIASEEGLVILRLGFGGHSQPRVHEMRAFYAALVEDGVHGNLPQPWKLRRSVACAGHVSTAVRQAVIEGVWPVRVSRGVGNRNARSGAGIVQEAGGSQSCDSLKGVVQEWSAEALDIGERDPSKRVKRNEVSVDFVGLGLGDVGHGVVRDLVPGNVPVGD